MREMVGTTVQRMEEEEIREKGTEERKGRRGQVGHRRGEG